jgi:transcription termination/antitermination protein NusA
MSVDISQLKEEINYICNEKGLDPDEVIKAIEKAIASAYRKEFGNPLKTYSCNFNVNTGKYSVYEEVKIIDPDAFTEEQTVASPDKEITISQARLYNPKAQVGDVIKTEVKVTDEVDFGRIASQIGRQVLMQSINASKHTRLLKEYKNKVGQLVNIEIDYPKKNGYIVKLGQTTTFLGHEALAANDRFRPGQMVKAVILSIREDEQGNTKIALSRSAEEFVLAILNQEIPEIESGHVIIKKIVREAGTRTKILVYSEDETIDPVGTILGRKNTRIINILREISNTMQEKIDVIEYMADDLQLMIMDALEPAQIDKVEINKAEGSAEVYCLLEEAYLAIGKRGANIRLASRLLDLELNIITTDENGNIVEREVKSRFDSELDGNFVELN